MTASLEFHQAIKEKEIQAVYDHNIDAFSDSPDFKWNLQEIKNEIKGGWELYSVSHKKEIVAALIVSVVDDCLFTKNTGLKMHHQGSGFSHEIKEFYEKLARELRVRESIELVPGAFEGLPAIMANANLAVSPRVDCDGIPLKILNYMAARKPVLAFKGSAPGLIHGQTAKTLGEKQRSSHWVRWVLLSMAVVFGLLVACCMLMLLLLLLVPA